MPIAHPLTMWSPPPAPDSPAPDRVRGALSGSLLFAQPRHAAVVSAITTFCAPPGPVVFEVGFDHGMRILSCARAWPDVRWLGAEIRKRRVEAASPHAPTNCLLLHADARTLLATVIPAGTLAQVDVLFPTPTDTPRHLLLTPMFALAVARSLAPDGTIHLATDVREMAELFRCTFEGWVDAAHPAAAPELSRRERVCRRDGLAIHRVTLRRPEDQP